VPRRLTVSRRRALGSLATLVALVALAAPGPATSSSDATVTISGRAYAFNHMDTYLSGATIRVRELPRLSAATNATGDYELEVPDDTTVTPYIEPPPGYHQIDLQTLHTRGEPIDNANFQVPGDAEYNGLAALLSVPIGPDGRPQQCVIVTTASARNVRGVPYETFHERTPHGVAGATARTQPALPGPTYFNESVIPDPAETATSNDGGIIWTGVPAGTYRVIVSSPATRFASFLATCEPGRIVNANPPWGAYELGPGEKALGASVVAGRVAKVGKGSKAGRRLVIVRVRTAEPLAAKLSMRQAGKAVVRSRRAKFGAPRDKVALRVSPAAERGRAKLTVKLTDAAGDTVTERLRVRLPRPPG
jgi:hypothetical protein